MMHMTQPQRYVTRMQHIATSPEAGHAVESLNMGTTDLQKS